ncbi:hypothetical protein EXIGLDRAFT_718946 [Exidia glandulosa HHB12029]|uniref:F-box domain-containing protein n=1 Tax=Exidia glandulosa HHB12029 TaxID=1314781 RepID=A0A165NT39_EXIGL|nr:hypothetical protein EXIGLDRAFT_718946 [Exidia glandulosa HHB12029]
MASTPAAAAQPVAPAQLLAVELWQAIFDHFLADELLSMSWVCRTWRDIARTHSNYCSAPRLRACHDGAVEWFLDRIEASSRPIRLQVTVGTPDDDKLLEVHAAQRILGALAHNMSRILELELDPIIFPDDCASGLTSLLTQSAPVLESFTFFGRGGKKIFQLPTNLFDDSAPRLWRLKLMDATLSRSSGFVPPALRSVQSLTYVLRTRHPVSTLYPHPFLVSILWALPALHDLSVNLLLDIDLLYLLPLYTAPVFDIRTFGRASVNIDHDDCMSQFLSWGPCALFPDLELPGRLLESQEMTTAALEHIVRSPGPIAVNVQLPIAHVLGVFQINVRNLDTRVVRSFARCAPEYVTHNPLPAHLAERVEYLHVQIGLLQHLHMWLSEAAVSGVTDLRIEMERGSCDVAAMFKAFAQRPPPFPGLRSLALLSHDGANVSASFVHELVSKVLRPTAEGFSILLHNVIILGDTGSLPFAKILL